MHPRSSKPVASRRGLALAAGAFLSACGGGGAGENGPAEPSGTLVAKPDGGFYLADPHRGGNASHLRLVEIQWGRLVAVHDVDAGGNANPIPLLRDVVIGDNVLSDGARFSLETDPISHAERLVIQRTLGAPDDGTGTFESLLRQVTHNLGPVLPKNDDGSATLPVSLVPRNAALLVRFDDLLDDGAEARAALVETVRLGAGYPPRIPHTARLVFDPNHGGLRGSTFHSTRVLVDLTVSQEEALELPHPTPVNAIGLPRSSELSSQPSAALRFPTRRDPDVGQYDLLTNLAGSALVAEGPVDGASQTLVRAWRAGNASDANGGFLLDLEPPRLLGAWEIAVEGARADPAGPPGLGLRVDLAFRTPCRAALLVGDVLELAGETFQVRANSGAPDAGGRVLDAQILARDETVAPGALLGLGLLLTPYRPAAFDPACWVTFVPRPGVPPGRGISSDAHVVVRFSEPMDPDFFRAYDTFRVLRGDAGVSTDVFATDLVVGAVQAEPDLQEFSFRPRLPFANLGPREYGFQIVQGFGGLRDLGGNALHAAFSRVEFELAADQEPRFNGGFALRFDGPDEVLPPELNDLRGQVSYDNGVLRPRPPAVNSALADRSHPVPGLMLPFAPGVQTPLSPLGSKLQAVWRYVDFGWKVSDESHHNIDVVGLSWSPVGGAVVSDYYRELELRLAHSRFLPDETPKANQAPEYPSSGLVAVFSENPLIDPRGSQKVVHRRALGYQVRPSDLVLGPGGTPLLPFSWNRTTSEVVSYTWRDTAVLAKAGHAGPGIPMDIEVGSPLFLDTGQGSLAGPGLVPSIGLPLLWEVRCYPTPGGLGLNSFDILLPVPGFPLPNFRAYSTGGIDAAGHPVEKDPELELLASGGFNPSSFPPGLPTALTADNSFYVGGIDYVVRVSRAHTTWIDTGYFAPRFAEPVVEPRTQPSGTSIVLEYRGADDFSGAGEQPFDATRLDPYGDFRGGTVLFHGDGTWSDDIGDADGARFLQIRFSFSCNVDSRLSPELDSLGVAFEE